MRFKRDEWVPGAKAVFEKFDGYAPRDEKANWLSGGKRVNFDRIEWQIIPEGATAAAALRGGEVDWLETPFTDLIPVLKDNKKIAVEIADPLGNIGSFRINHLYPPFSDVRARHAVQIALSQEDYMGAVVGNDEALWRTLPGFFTPDTPLYTENGGAADVPARLEPAELRLERRGTLAAGGPSRTEVCLKWCAGRLGPA